MNKAVALLEEKFADEEDGDGRNKSENTIAIAQGPLRIVRFGIIGCENDVNAGAQ